MERAQKETVVGSIKDKFDRMTSAVFLDFKGLNVDEVSKLRDEFRKSGVEYKRREEHAGAPRDRAPRLGEEPHTSLVGMTGVAWSYEDPSAAAKVVKAFLKDGERRSSRSRPASSRGRSSSAEAVEIQLATMPGKNELRAMLLATMQAPLQQFLQQLQRAAQNFVYLLKAKEDQANGGAPAAEG